MTDEFDPATQWRVKALDDDDNAFSLELLGFRWRVLTQVADVDGLPQLVGLSLLPRSDSTEHLREAVVTVERLRQFPLSNIRKAVIRHRGKRLVGKGHTPELLEMVRTAMGMDDRRQAGRLTDEHYVNVASVYNTALATGEAPRKAVMEAWTPISRAAASKWIKEAKARGLITSAVNETGDNE